MNRSIIEQTTKRSHLQTSPRTHALQEPSRPRLSQLIKDFQFNRVVNIHLLPKRNDFHIHKSSIVQKLFQLHMRVAVEIIRKLMFNYEKGNRADNAPAFLRDTKTLAQEVSAIGNMLQGVRGRNYIKALILKGKTACKITHDRCVWIRLEVHARVLKLLEKLPELQLATAQINQSFIARQVAKLFPEIREIGLTPLRPHPVILA